MITTTYQNALWRSRVLVGQGDRLTKERRIGRPPVKLPDEQVLEARARHEYCGWSPQRIARAYGLDLAYARAMLNYATRSRLYPEPHHANLEPQQ